jgi:hypothetical protein
MSKAQPIHSQIDTRELLANAAKMGVQELEALMRELNNVLSRKKHKDKDHRERELLRLINETVLAKEKRERYWMLSLQLEEGSISAEEHRELMQLAGEEEWLRNKRVAYLVELSQLRNLSLSQVMEEMGLKPPGHG